MYIHGLSSSLSTALYITVCALDNRKGECEILFLVVVGRPPWGPAATRLSVVGWTYGPHPRRITVQPNRSIFAPLVHGRPFRFVRSTPYRERDIHGYGVRSTVRYDGATSHTIIVRLAWLA